VEAKALNDKLDKLLADREVAQQNQVLWLKWQNATALELHPTLWDRYMRISFESLSMLVKQTKQLNSGVTQAPPSISTQPSLLGPRTPSQVQQTVYAPTQYARQYAGPQQQQPYGQDMPYGQMLAMLQQPGMVLQQQQPGMGLQQQQPGMVLQQQQPGMVLQQQQPGMVLQQQQQHLRPMMLPQQQGPPNLMREQTFGAPEGMMTNLLNASATQQQSNLADVSSFSVFGSMSDVNTSQLDASMNLSGLVGKYITGDDDADKNGDNKEKETDDKKDAKKDKDEDGL
jgi:hypothetical protein